MDILLGLGYFVPKTIVIQFLCGGQKENKKTIVKRIQGKSTVECSFMLFGQLLSDFTLTKRTVE